MAADLFMIVLGLAGGVNTHKFKWGYFAMSCFCEVAINIGLLFCGMRAAMARGGGISKVYAGLAAYLSVLWWGYPIVWGLAEGANVISSDAEVTSLLFLYTFIICWELSSMVRLEGYTQPLLLPLPALAFASLLLGTSMASIMWCLVYSSGKALPAASFHRWCCLTCLMAIAGCCVRWIGHCCQGVFWLAGHGHIPHCHQAGGARVQGVSSFFSLAVRPISCFGLKQLP